jgi:hypothetical protein
MRDKEDEARIKAYMEAKMKHIKMYDECMNLADGLDVAKFAELVRADERDRLAQSPQVRTTTPEHIEKIKSKWDKTRASKHYRVLPDRSGPDLGPSYHAGMIECNLRIDFANDGSIYNVAWSNNILTPLKKEKK